MFRTGVHGVIILKWILNKNARLCGIYSSDPGWDPVGRPYKRDNESWDSLKKADFPTLLRGYEFVVKRFVQRIIALI
jgi:hypothetical protein